MRIFKVLGNRDIREGTLRIFLLEKEKRFKNIII